MDLIFYIDSFTVKGATRGDQVSFGVYQNLLNVKIQISNVK